MKKILIFILFTVVTLGLSAQNESAAKKVLDKTAAVVGHRGGASARFTISSPKIGSSKGAISIKGAKFHATTGQAIVWYNGKTQWSYLKSTNEVNVTTPTEAQRMKMNPYTFITMYKNGYNLGMKTQRANYLVHLTAQNKQRSVQEVYLTINKANNRPSLIKMREGQTWTTITLTNFKTGGVSDKVFTFNAKDFPTAEVVDLR